MIATGLPSWTIAARIPFESAAASSSVADSVIGRLHASPFARRISSTTDV
jgi:hypothetical protein